MQRKPFFGVMADQCGGPTGNKNPGGLSNQMESSADFCGASQSKLEVDQVASVSICRSPATSGLGRGGRSGAVLEPFQKRCRATGISERALDGSRTVPE